ncbi:MAG TPA: hypothetical protein VGN05_00515 [Parvibaculum sp.]|jgi:hypothetical protein
MRKNHTLATLAFAAAGFSFLIAGPALAAPQVSKEVAAAAQHAGLAAKGGDINEVHTHLHHTINCLVGPEGKGFAPKEMNPCKPLGTGAIPDTADAAKKKALEAALAKAEAGLAETDFAKAKTAAADTQAALTPLE